MSVSALKTAARQLGLWGSLLLVTALLTLLFNILGTITCAVATGVIMGTARRWTWKTVPASAIFALAGLALMQVAKADLTLAQRLWMAGLSVGAFLGMYLLTLFFMCLEKAPSGGVDADASGTNALRMHNGASLKSLGTPEPSHPLSLRDLQGRWLCETTGQDGPVNQRIMEIAEGRFTLKIRGPGGCARLAAEGEMKLETTDVVTTLAILPTGRQ